MTIFKKDLLNTNVPSIGENNPDIFLQKQLQTKRNNSKKPNPEQNNPPKPKQKAKTVCRVLKGLLHKCQHIYLYKIKLF